MAYYYNPDTGFFLSSDSVLKAEYKNGEIYVQGPALLFIVSDNFAIIYNRKKSNFVTFFSIMKSNTC